MTVDHRKATRIEVDEGAKIINIGQPQSAIAPADAVHYSRVIADVTRTDERTNGRTVDVSTNGVFIACSPFPLLSRVGIEFNFHDQLIQAIGWVLWTRNQDLVHPRLKKTLPQGMGILFESIPFSSREAIFRTIKG